MRERRVVPSGGLPRSPVPAAIARGAPAMPTGGGNAAKSRVSLTRLTGDALAVAPFAEASVPQAGGTDSAPTLTALANPADTAPPTGAVPTEPRVVATLPSPALTSVNAAAVEWAAVAAEFDPAERAESADKIMDGTVAKALIPELTVSGSSALFMSARICWVMVSTVVEVCVPPELATVALWAAKPPGLVFCCGGLNGVSFAAVAEEPA